jgi:hypothetical protein
VSVVETGNMKQLLLLTLMAGMVVVSCSKKGTAHEFGDGTYKGTFQRLHNGNGDISNVTITFSAKNWQGQSDVGRYPALCNGSYTMNGEIIHFANACMWTADFDWTLILNGDYKFSSKGNSIEIWRYAANGDKDVYKLTKQ